MKTIKLVSQEDILFYEVGASWWSGLVGNSFLQNLASSYFAWKVKRKYKRYLYMMHRKALIDEYKKRTV